jgi:hypothetical protein
MRTGIIILFVLLFRAAVGQVNDKTLLELISPKTSGIDFENELKETEAFNVLSYEYLYNGGGVAAGDINNDGLIDLYFTANMKADRLFLNLGNLRFKDITKQAKIFSDVPWKTGVTMADVNADGWLDIYVCYSGNGDTRSRRNKLYINKGDLTFEESAKKFGLDDSGYSTQAAFFDYDRDGDLDMYLVNHNIKDYKEVELVYVKATYDSLAADRLYKNDNGFFKDVSNEAGITGNPISFGLGISIADINKDGWPDIYVANDYREHDYLYINNKDGTFKEQVKECLQHISEFSMGNDIADFNNDALPDIYTVDMLPEDNRRQKLLQGPENYELYRASVNNGFHHQFMRNMLQLNNGDGTFSEIGQLAGVSNTDWSWSALFADLDNDGWKDLIVTNGYLRDYTNKDFLKFWGKYVVDQAMKMEKTLLMDIVKNMPSTLTSNYGFKNNGDLTFTDATKAWGLNQLMLSSGAIYADLDNDGDLDLVINNVNATASIYRNTTMEQKKQHYLQLAIKGNKQNKNGFGTKATLYAGTLRQYAELQPTRGYQSSVDPILHFGLGSQIRVDSIIIEGPTGEVQKLTNVNADQRLAVQLQEQISVGPTPRGSSTPHFEEIQPLFVSRHTDLTYNDFKRQPLMPHMFSYQAPALASGDFNGDGLDDIFVGGSRGKACAVFLQKTDGTFYEAINAIFTADRYFTTTDVILFDADNDNDLDIFATSGGYHEYEDGNVLLSDRIYLNNGNANFSERKFMPFKTAKSCVVPMDMDADGDLDLFIGGSVIPGQYPESPRSYLLQNDGKANFAEVTQQWSPELLAPGMITDAIASDFNGDGKPDLAMVGELMEPTIFINTGSSFTNKTREYFSVSRPGLYNTLSVADLDGDGDEDLIAGNFGLNSQIKASPKEPLELVYKDFDQNGSVDPFLCFYIQGKSYPYVTRDELLDQIYGMRKKFTSYKSYADATLAEIFSPEELKGASKLSANTLETVIFENINGKFERKALPIQAQYAPVHHIQIADIDGDQYPDLILFGNESFGRLRLGKSDANYGVVLLNRKQCQFAYQNQTTSGLHVTGDARQSLMVNTSQGRILVVSVHNRPISFYKLNVKSHEQ